MNTRHNPENIVQCSFCSCVFATERAKNKHETDMHNKIHSHAKLSDVSDYAHQNTFMPWTDDMTYTEENVTPSRVVAYAVGRTDWLSIKYASIKRIISRQQCSDIKELQQMGLKPMAKFSFGPGKSNHSMNNVKQKIRRHIINVAGSISNNRAHEKVNPFLTEILDHLETLPQLEGFVSREEVWWTSKFRKRDPSEILSSRDELEDLEMELSDVDSQINTLQQRKADLKQKIELLRWEREEPY